MRLIDADAAILDARANYGGVNDAVLMEHFLNSQPTIAPPPNDPLTLEELREMDGEPVWLVGVSSSFPNGNWDICDWSNMEIALFPYCQETPDLELYGKTWFAYRRKP